MDIVWYYVRDLDAARRFYASKLGFTEASRDEVEGWVKLERGRTKIGLAQGEPQLCIDAWGDQRSTPPLVECLLVGKKFERALALFAGKRVARVVSGGGIIEEIGVIHLDTFIAIMPEFWRMPFPLGIVMRDVT